MQNLRSRVLVSALETGIVPAMRQRPVFVRTVADDQYEIDEHYELTGTNWPTFCFWVDVDDDCEAAWYDYADEHATVPVVEYEPSPEAVQARPAQMPIMIDLRANDEHLLGKDRQSRRRHDTARVHERKRSKMWPGWRDQAADTDMCGRGWGVHETRPHRLKFSESRQVTEWPTTRQLRERCALKADLADLLAPIK